MKVGVILSITKKQHYVSQGVLKHFADEHRKTYELFIDKNLVSKKSIVDTMSQNYVYEHPKIETNMIEDIFASFESKAFPVIDLLISEIDEDYKTERSIKKYNIKIKRLIIITPVFCFLFDF